VSARATRYLSPKVANQSALMRTRTVVHLRERPPAFTSEASVAAGASRGKGVADAV
jgi:hypothetical protein